MTPNTPESFWARTRREGPCLIWTGYRDRAGYGVINFANAKWKAHRLAWALTRGPIPPGLFICHTCDNPPCVEPLHLFPATEEINNLDRSMKGRDALSAVFGELNHRAFVTDAQVAEIRQRAALGESLATLAAEYGVAKDTVWYYVRLKRRVLPE